MVPHEHHTITSADGPEAGIVKIFTMPASSFVARAISRRAGQVLVIGVPIIVLVLFVLYPLAAIILQSIFPQLYAALRETMRTELVQIFRRLKITTINVTAQTK
jgi:hypothetical protein